MKKLVWLVLILGILLLTVACGSEVVTTAPTTTQTPMETTPTQTTPVTTNPIVTSTLCETTVPETTSPPEWMDVLEENFFEKAVEENGKYYIYLTYDFGYREYAVRDNQTFVEAYVADKDDIVFANLEKGMVSQGIYLRATAEEIEAYAKNSYVTGIYSYPADKLLDGCKGTVDGAGFYEKYIEYAENKEAVLDRTQVPLVKIDSREEMDAFYGVGIHSEYDEAYFAEKSLFMILIRESTGSARHALVHVIADQGVTVVIDRASPGLGTADAPVWEVIVEVDKSAIANQTSFKVIMHSTHNRTVEVS